MSANSEAKPSKRGRLRRWLQNLALMAGAFLFCFLILEIVLRSGHVVRVPSGADTNTLQRVLQALQTAC